MDFQRDDLFAAADGEPSSRPVRTSRPAPATDRVTLALGTMVRRWGELERAAVDKLAQLRAAAGDISLIGGRSRPTLAILIAELRALVSIRDRHDRNTLIQISEIETSIQRASQFHHLVIDGFRTAESDMLLCRDDRNTERRVCIADVHREIATLERITLRLCAI